MKKRGRKSGIAGREKMEEVLRGSKEMFEKTFISQHKRTEEDLRRRAEVFAALYETSLDITKPHELPTLLDTIVKRAVQLLHGAGGGMYICDPERQEVRAVVSCHTTRDYTGTVLKYGEGAAGVVAQTGKPIIIDDYRTWPGRAKVFDKEQPFTAVISVPIIWQDEVIGVIHVLDNIEERRFSQGDLELLTLFANQAVLAIQNTRLVEQVQRHADELRRRVVELEERDAELKRTNEELTREASQRKRTDEALKESEVRYSTLFDNISDFIYTHDLKGRFLTVNRAAAQSLGYKPEDLVGRPISEFMLPEYRQAFYDEYLVQVKRQGSFNGVSAYLAKDGTTHYIEYRNVLMTQEGRESYVSGSGRDITQRMHADEALRRSEEKYRTILETMEEGYFEVDLAGNLVFFNDTLCKITGYSKRKLIGMNNREYTTPETAKRMYQIFNEIYRTGKPAKVMDFEIIKRDSSKVILEMSTSLMQSPKGNPIGFRGVVRDVTERKHAEEERKALEAQLQQAQKMEAVGTLAGGIAHNFNNLLMSIQGNASLMLLETEPYHPNFNRLRNIEKSVQSGSRLTSQLLGYARGGKYKVAPLDINLLVQQTSETFAATKREMRIHRELAEGLHGVQADQGQVEQILWNLYVNAAEAMPRGGELFLTTANATHKDMTAKPYKVKPGNYVFIAVRDTGIGMDKKTVERIFEPFFTTKGLARGTGLGLASVYGMVKAHGGYIDVDSKRGHGTTFRIYLPASEMCVSKKEIAKAKIEKGKETLLIVDDEELVLEVSQEMLETLGYTILTTKGGKEAVEMYQAHKENIDLVILDMIMPDMGGGETYDELKGINPEVKVLLSSGYSINGQASEILKRGCDGFLQKPFDVKDLSRKVRDILDKE
jgi:two-component system cell cycle sensor histidine kinase/response regulator CckA